MFEDIFIESKDKECTINKRTIEVRDDDIMMSVKESHLKESRGDVIARLFERSMRSIGMPMNVNFELEMPNGPESTRWTFRMKLDEEQNKE